MRFFIPIIFALLMVSTSFVGISYNLEKSLAESFDSNIFYVGGNGPGNYTKIQDAIDNATDGDTVFVYNGTYYEHLVINVSINLIGEDKETTIIDGEFKGNCVVIKADGVVVKRFTIRNAYWGPGGPSYTGLVIKSSYNKISENILHHHYYKSISIDNSNNEVFSNYIYSSNSCILSYGSKNNSIYNNTLNTGDTAIIISSSKNCKVYNNTIERAVNNGIFVGSSFNNKIRNNFITDCEWGIHLVSAEFTFISKNNIIDNGVGVLIVVSSWSFIFCNNFESNWRPGRHFESASRWINNYYGKPRTLPKIIWGEAWIDIPYIRIPYPSITVDWYPAQEPYDIEV